jgi:hypothetical protein
MSRSKVLGALVVLVTLAMTAIGAAQAAEPDNLSQAAADHPQAALCAVDASGNVQAVPLAQFLAMLAAAAQACNGGSCSGGGNTLNCPTSGGPTCTAKQICICDCFQNTNGTWSTANACVKGTGIGTD